MGTEDWFGDPRFANDDARAIHGTILNARMQAWCASRTLAEATAELDAARIPVGPLYSPQQALDDPHVQAMGFLKPMSYPGLPAPAPVIETPFRMSATPGDIRMRAPTLGEHTDAVLAEIGCTRDEIVALRTGGIV